MQENVERPDDLYEGPQTSWLGYLSLAERVDIADYADYIEQVRGCNLFFGPKTGVFRAKNTIFSTF